MINSIHSIVPAVGAELLQAVVNRHLDDDDHSIAHAVGVCAMVANPQDESEKFKALSIRFLALTDVLFLHRSRIMEHEGFPVEWIEIAATAPLTMAQGLDSNLFVWSKPVAA